MSEQHRRSGLPIKYCTAKEPNCPFSGNCLVEPKTGCSNNSTSAPAGESDFIQCDDCIVDSCAYAGLASGCNAGVSLKQHDAAIKAEAITEERGRILEDYTRELKERICKSNLPSPCFERLSMIIHDTVVALRGS